MWQMGKETGTLKSHSSSSAVELCQILVNIDVAQIHDTTLLSQSVGTLLQSLNFICEKDCFLTFVMLYSVSKAIPWPLFLLYS